MDSMSLDKIVKATNAQYIWTNDLCENISHFICCVNL